MKNQRSLNTEMKGQRSVNSHGRQRGTHTVTLESIPVAKREMCALND